MAQIVFLYYVHAFLTNDEKRQCVHTTLVWCEPWVGRKGILSLINKQYQMKTITWATDILPVDLFHQFVEKYTP